MQPTTLATGTRVRCVRPPEPDGVGTIKGKANTRGGILYLVKRDDDPYRTKRYSPEHIVELAAEPKTKRSRKPRFWQVEWIETVGERAAAIVVAADAEEACERWTDDRYTIDPRAWTEIIGGDGDSEITEVREVTDDDGLYAEYLAYKTKAGDTALSMDHWADRIKKLPPHHFGAVHHDALAQLIADADRYDDGEIIGPGLVEALINMLTADNPNFDAVRFKIAAEITNT